MASSTKIVDFTSAVVVLLAGAIALYVALWLCLIGGIIDIINAFSPFTLGLLALGVLKLFVTDMAGFGIFAVGVMIADWLKGETHDHPKTS